MENSIQSNLHTNLGTSLAIDPPCGHSSRFCIHVPTCRLTLQGPKMLSAHHCTAGLKENNWLVVLSCSRASLNHVQFFLGLVIKHNGIILNTLERKLSKKAGNIL